MLHESVQVLLQLYDYEGRALPVGVLPAGVTLDPELHPGVYLLGCPCKPVAVAACWFKLGLNPLDGVCPAAFYY